MARSSKKLSPSETKQQLRGEALQNLIEMVIRELAANAKKSGVKYEYNASATARMVPTTRKSLAKHGEIVARILRDLDARRRMATGEVTAEHLRDQVAYLKEQIAGRDKTIAALRAHHIDIYKRFHEHSLDAELLIRPILHKESEETGECILCGANAEPLGKSNHKSNVVQLKRGASTQASK